MPTVPVLEPTAMDSEAEEILADPEVRAPWEALDNPEDRQDLIDHLKALTRLKEGKDQLIPWEEALKQLGLLTVYRLPQDPRTKQSGQIARSSPGLWRT